MRTIFARWLELRFRVISNKIKHQSIDYAIKLNMTVSEPSNFIARDLNSLQFSIISVFPELESSTTRFPHYFGKFILKNTCPAISV